MKKILFSSAFIRWIDFLVIAIVFVVLGSLVSGPLANVAPPDLFSWIGIGLPFAIGAVSYDVKGQLLAGPIQGVSIAYKNKNYIADRVFPIVERVGPKAKITRYPKGAWFRDEAGIRGPGSRANRGNYPLDSVAVAFDEYAFAKEVTDEDRQNARDAGAPQINLEQDAAEFCADKIDLKKERLIKALIVGTTWSDGNGSGGEDAAGLWAAGASNTFLADIRNGVGNIHGKTGNKPNKLLLDLGTFLSLKEETTILTKIQYTQRGVLTAELLAALLELEEVLVGDAVYSSAKEVKDGTDFTAVKIWEYNATKGMGFLFYAPPRPGLKVPMAGIQARGAYANGTARRVMTWREEAEHQDVYEVAEETDIVVTGSDLGYLWKDTLLT